MINEKVIIVPIAVFVTILIIHVIAWRVIKPRKHMTPLFVAFILLPAILFAAAGLKGGIFTLYELSLMAILYLALAGAYIQTYPAMQAWSPSLFIMYLIGKSASGLSMEELKMKMSSDYLIKDRINDLVNDGLVNIGSTDSSVTLTAKGRTLAVVFGSYRRILGLSEGAG